MKDAILVAVENVSFSYKGELVLDHINLDIRRGEFLGIIGPNGSGKTTLLKIILSLLKPNVGSVRLFGKEISQFSDWSKIGYVPQKAGLTSVRFPITVEEVVRMAATSNQAQQDIDNALAAVTMADYKQRLLAELSGGEQQRVFIARALVTKPELLVLDEPTVGVDVDSQAKFYGLLNNLHTQRKLTLVLVSHDIDVVAHQVQTVACINRTLICHGKPNEVMTGDFMAKLYGKNLRFIIHGH